MSKINANASGEVSKKSNAGHISGRLGKLFHRVFGGMKETDREHFSVEDNVVNGVKDDVKSDVKDNVEIKDAVLDAVQDTVKEHLIHNLIILDGSGSMSSIYEQALGGANETIRIIRSAQKQAPMQRQYLSFVTFSSNRAKSQVRTIIDDEPIDSVKLLTREDYRLGGSTPLYDAMGISLTNLENNVGSDEKVLVTIITDGMENDSRKYSAGSIKKLVGRLRSKGWTFVYIGANQDAVEVANDLGVKNALNFEETSVGTEEMWENYRGSTVAYYEKARRSELRGEYFDEDQDFFNEKAKSRRITPGYIHRLLPNEIVVFGSNILGHHNGSLAEKAVNEWGAVNGRPNGRQGQCYAIATDGATLDSIRFQVQGFIEYARSNPHLLFLVTRIGCGNAGWHAGQIAPQFRDAGNVPNICLPQEFWDILNK